MAVVRAFGASGRVAAIGIARSRRTMISLGRFELDDATTFRFSRPAVVTVPSAYRSIDGPVRVTFCTCHTPRPRAARTSPSVTRVVESRPTPPTYGRTADRTGRAN